jgi:hypothetical protein
MSTRCNAVFTDKDQNTLWFYRHNDGYPKYALPAILKLLKNVKKGLIRDNVIQACGWMIVYGREEAKRAGYLLAHSSYRWKVGEWEPTTERHGDIEYLYVVDLSTCTVIVMQTDGKNDEILYKKTIT